MTASPAPHPHSPWSPRYFARHMLAGVVGAARANNPGALLTPSSHVWHPHETARILGHRTDRWLCRHMCDDPANRDTP